MTSARQHKVLVVDDDAQVGKAICQILAMKKLESVYANSGESALEILKTADQPFSLIISAQRMDGMQGTQFLEHAKKQNPETIRFLTTEYSEMKTIIDAVNKGAVQKYISKPWDNDELDLAIDSGIRQYEQFLENKTLISLAKKQNAKLYELNCELMETTKAHAKELTAIDTEILSAETQIKELPSHPPTSPAEIILELQEILEPPLDEKSGEKGVEKSQEMLNNLFSQTITALFSNFNDLALKNGFEMPDPVKNDNF